MSLKRFIQQPHVRSELECFRPTGTRRIPVPIQVHSRTNNPQRLGTAFDYLLRFEIQRRVRKAETEPWIAEHATSSKAIRMIVTIPSFDELYELLKQGSSVTPVSGFEDRFAIDCPRLGRRVAHVLRAAKGAEAIYRKKRKPSARDHATLAGHALRLASLDAIVRADTEVLPSDFDKVDRTDVAQLVELLGTVPFEKVISGGRMLLNPTFGAASRLVGGADADVISGDMLIDVKTVKENSAQSHYLDQLLGYFILARHARRLDKAFPIINRLGIYFSRHGYLWTWDVTALHSDREFLLMEQWFVDEAAGRHAIGTARHVSDAG